MTKPARLPYKTRAELRASAPTAAYREPCYGLRFGIEIFEKYEYLIPGKTVLDCGTGGGHFLIFLSRRGYQPFGFDVVDMRVEPVGKFACVDANVETLPYPDNSFDGVTAWCLLPHLENPHHAIREIQRVLKPGGIFFNEMPHIASLYMKKRYLLTGELDRYTEDNDHISVVTPAIYKKTVLKYFTEISEEYWVDPKIYQNRFGWLKKIGVAQNWQTFKKLYAAEVIQVLQK